MQRKILPILGWFLCLCLSSSALAQKVVKLNCPGPTFSPKKSVLKKGGCVQFVLGNCNNVTIQGGNELNNPIGVINLNQGGQTTATVCFNNKGAFTVQATGALGDGTNVAAIDTLTIVDDIPTQSTYGLIILVLFLAGTAIWLFHKRLAVEKGGLA